MAIAPESLTSLSAQELREMVTGLMVRIGERDRQITQRDAQIVQNDESLASKDREIKYRQAKIGGCQDSCRMKFVAQTASCVG